MPELPNLDCVSCLHTQHRKTPIRCNLPWLWLLHVNITLRTSYYDAANINMLNVRCHVDVRTHLSVYQHMPCSYRTFLKKGMLCSPPLPRMLHNLLLPNHVPMCLCAYMPVLICLCLCACVPIYLGLYACAYVPMCLCAYAYMPMCRAFWTASLNAFVKIPAHDKYQCIEQCPVY